GGCADAAASAIACSSASRIALIAANPPAIGVTRQLLSHGSACPARAAIAVPSPQGLPSPPAASDCRNHFAGSANETSRLGSAAARHAPQPGDPNTALIR